MRTFSHRIRHMAIQSLRRLLQAIVIVWLVALVYLSLYAHYRAAHALDDDTELTGSRRVVLHAMHERIDAMEKPQEFLDANKGNIWAMRVGGLELADPLAASQVVLEATRRHGGERPDRVQIGASGKFLVSTS